MAGGRCLVAGSWWRVAGGWWLVAGGWWLVAPVGVDHVAAACSPRPRGGLMLLLPVASVRSVVRRPGWIVTLYYILHAFLVAFCILHDCSNRSIFGSRPDFACKWWPPLHLMGWGDVEVAEVHHPLAPDAGIAAAGGWGDVEAAEVDDEESASPEPEPPRRGRGRPPGLHAVARRFAEQMRDRKLSQQQQATDGASSSGSAMVGGFLQLLRPVGGESMTEDLHLCLQRRSRINWAKHEYCKGAVKFVDMTLEPSVQVSFGSQKCLSLMSDIPQKNVRLHTSEVGALVYLTSRMALSSELSKLLAARRQGQIELVSTCFCEGFDATPMLTTIQPIPSGEEVGDKRFQEVPESNKLMQSDLHYAVAFKHKDKPDAPIELRYGELPCCLKICDSQTAPLTVQQLNDDLSIALWKDVQRESTHRFAVGNSDEGQI